MMKKTALKEIASPPKGRTLSRGVKRILEDARYEPEAFLRYWRAGRGGE